MESRCERHGQLEIGIITHEGKEFRAGGASVVGKHVTGYLRAGSSRYKLALATFCGQTMLECRAEIVERYRLRWGDETEAIVFRLTNGRAIVGYSLGEGMLFRGELIDQRDIDEAARIARGISEYFITADDESEESDEE